MSKSTISLSQLAKMFPDEESARKYMEGRRWPQGAACPTCGEAKRIGVRPNGFYRCNPCKVDFTVRTDTIFGRSHIPLDKWILAMYLLMTARKGVSSLQLGKEIGVTQKSAWFMLGRLREACGNDPTVLRGIVEIDETYIGGKEKNKHNDKKLRAGRGTVGKTPVLGMRERGKGGRTKARPVSRTDALNLQSEIRLSVEAGSMIHTDEHGAYRGLSATYGHETVDHSAKEYVRDNVTTNGIESVWAVMKRGLHGVYHHASEKHLHRYVDEFTFRLLRPAPYLQGTDGMSSGLSALNSLTDTVLNYSPAKKPAKAKKPIKSDTHIACADNLEFMKGLKDGSMQLIVTSPPYNIGKAYEANSSIEAYIAAQTKVIKECVRVLDPRGSLCWQVGNHVHNGEIFPLDMMLGPIIQGLGLKLRNRVVWHFEHGLHCSKRLSGRYETILWFTKGDDYIFNLDPIRVPSKYPGKKYFKGPKAGQLSGNPLGKNPGDVWVFPNVKNNHVEKEDHPCQFPVELVERLVLSLTEKGGAVLDPYMGVGSALVGAAMHGRVGYGCDIVKKYVTIAQRRISKLEAGGLKTRPMHKPVYDPALPYGGHR